MLSGLGEITTRAGAAGVFGRFRPLCPTPEAPRL